MDPLNFIVLFTLLKLTLKNSSALLKALKNNGVPANERGETGPMVINEYSRLSVSKDECGSRNS